MSNPQFALQFALTSGKTSRLKTFPDKSETTEGEETARVGEHKNVNAGKRIQRLASAENVSILGGPGRGRTYDQVIMSHLL